MLIGVSLGEDSWMIFVWICRQSERDCRGEWNTPTEISLSLSLLIEYTIRQSMNYSGCCIADLPPFPTIHAIALFPPSSCHFLPSYSTFSSFCVASADVSKIDRRGRELKGGVFCLTCTEYFCRGFWVCQIFSLSLQLSHSLKHAYTSRGCSTHSSKALPLLS